MSDDHFVESNEPVRLLHKSAPHRTVGGILIKELTAYPAEYESNIEQRAILALALCHDVLEIRSQPKKFHYVKVDGKNGFHIPDFQVVTEQSSYFIEVKAIANLVEKKNIEKYTRIAQQYAKQNESLVFLVDAQIEDRPRFAAIKLLSRYLTSTPANEVIDKALQTLSFGPLTINQLMSQSSLELREIYTLIAKRYLSFDWNNSHLSPSTVVSLPNQPFRGLHLDNLLRSSRYSHLLEELAMGREPSDQPLMAVAKNWRQLNNTSTVWGVVGGFVPQTPIRAVQEAGFPRASQLRRNYAPGFYHPDPTE